MNEGDVVEVAGLTGVVERLTIRSVSIRSLDGTVHLVPFSSVDAVSNMMKGFSFHVAEVAWPIERISRGEGRHAGAFDRLMETRSPLPISSSRSTSTGVTPSATRL